MGPARAGGQGEDLPLCSFNLSGKLQQTPTQAPTPLPAAISPVSGAAGGSQQGTARGSARGGKEGCFLCLLEMRAVLPLTWLQNAYRHNALKDGGWPDAVVKGTTRG